MCVKVKRNKPMGFLSHQPRFFVTIFFSFPFLFILTVWVGYGRCQQSVGFRRRHAVIHVRARHIVGAGRAQCATHDKQPNENRAPQSSRRHHHRSYSCHHQHKHVFAPIFAGEEEPNGPYVVSIRNFGCVQNSNNRCIVKVCLSFSYALHYIIIGERWPVRPTEIAGQIRTARFVC